MTTSSNSNDPIVLIPLGGLGQRFADEGHSSPKPLIKALGDPILYWLLNSLNINTRSSSSSSSGNHVRCVLIPYHPELGKFRFEDRLRKDFPHIPFVFVPLTGNTMGAADTMRIALQSLGLDFSDSPIISLDGDNFYTIDLLSMWIGKESLDNCLITFDDDGDKPIYSYVRLGENDDDDRNKRNKIVEIKEKVKISNQACTGAYGFSSWKQLLQYSLKTLSNPANKQKNEFYISSVIALMIHAGEIFETLRVPIDDYVCLGTPLQLRAFCNDFPRRAIGSYSYNAEMQQRLTSAYLTDAHAPPPPQHPQLAESQWMQRYQQSPEGLAVSNNNNKCKPNPQFSPPTSACVVYVGLSYMPKRVATDEHAPAYDLDYDDCGAWENHRTNITDSLARMGIATSSFVMATNANPRHSHFCSLLSADPTHIDAVSPEDEAGWIKNWAGGFLPMSTSLCAATSS